MFLMRLAFVHLLDFFLPSSKKFMCTEENLVHSTWCVCDRVPWCGMEWQTVLVTATDLLAVFWMGFFGWVVGQSQSLQIVCV